MKSRSSVRYLLLFIPWLLASLFKSDPQFSYIIAWLGSFYIFFITLTGTIKPLPADRHITEQLMRPIFLVQIIFAGYMCCTSIFYYLDVLGYEDFHEGSKFFLVDQNKLQLTAQCQRYYCLAHASFVLGILMFMDYPQKQKYTIGKDKIANLLLVTAVISFPVSLLFLKIPGLSQFYFQFNSLSFIACTLALAFAIPLKKVINTLICLFFYLSNFYNALISGYKEPIIISVLVLGIFLYPNYKKVVLATFVPLLMVIFMLLPTYNKVFRANAWAGDIDAESASQLALEATLDQQDDDQDETNWDFLVLRLSEIDMFTRFVQTTPAPIDFYRFQLIKQSVFALIPRVFWPGKPNTEALIMERVFNAGVINRNSHVSAKPAYVVDAYLFWGNMGIVTALFAYGAVAQILSVLAEKLFGGYLLGTALIFSGLFQILWRGMSFEFVVNTVFWSYITMLIIHKILVARNILKPV